MAKGRVEATTEPGVSLPWVSIRDASQILKVSTRTVRRMITAGTLPSRLEGGIRLVLVRDGQDHPDGPPPGPRRRPQPLAPLFAVFEDLRALQQEARRIVGFSQATHRQFASLGGADHPDPRDWLRLARRITAAAEPVDRLVQLRQLDPEVLDKAYRALLEVRDVWTHYAAILCPDIQATPDDPDAQSWHAVPLARITRIIGNLRRLLGG